MDSRGGFRSQVTTISRDGKMRTYIRSLEAGEVQVERITRTVMDDGTHVARKQTIRGESDPAEAWLLTATPLK